jgi:uncharacterized protein
VDEEQGTIRLRTSDGVEIGADLAVPASPGSAWAGAVVCHPHPAFGGDRYNIVVDAVFRALAEAGATAVRFDFRPGAGADGGSDEQLDVGAALDRVAACLAPGRPLWLVGYSFGADVALSVDDPRVAGWVAVAPPLRFGAPRPAVGDTRPVLVVAAEHDQFAPPDQVRAASALWSAAEVTVVPGADHFLVGATAEVADRTLTWLRSRSLG